MKKADISKTTKISEHKQFCPNCGKSVTHSSRYPKYICHNCKKLITDKNGKSVVFYNTELLGYGCQGYYCDNAQNEKYNSNICFIRDKKFFAQEARFGGIVIQEMNKSNNERS
ncbi:MAG: hypothetical protein V1720_14170 [bacterium]